MSKAGPEQLCRLHCEKILNETWSKVSLHYDELKNLIQKGGIENEADESLALVAANAALQKMTLDMAIDDNLDLFQEEEFSSM